VLDVVVELGQLMVELRTAVPDLADLAAEERMGFGESIAAWRTHDA
jgi:hypothetical protein